MPHTKEQVADLLHHKRSNLQSVIFPTSHCEMNVLKEQCFCIKFYWKLHSTTTNRYEMLHQAFGEAALNQKTFDWKIPSSPWPKKVKQIWSKISPMLITFTIRRTFLKCLGGAVC